METVGQLDTGYGGDTVADGTALDAYLSASAELSRHRTVGAVAEAALSVALDLTRSTVAFIALMDDNGEKTQVYSRAADPEQATPPDEIARAAAAAGTLPSPVGTTSPWAAPTGRGLRAIKSSLGHPLHAGGRILGTIGVASPSGYTAFHERGFTILAYQVAGAISLAELNERRQQ